MVGIRRIGRAASLLIGLAAGCEEPTTTTVPTAAASVVKPLPKTHPSVSPARSAAPVGSAHPDVPPFVRAELRTITNPDTPACVFETANWQPARGTQITLRFHDKAPPFAALTAGPIRLAVPSGVAQNAIAETDRDGLILRGQVWVDRDAEPAVRHSPRDAPVVLWPKRAFVLGGVMVVTPDTKIAWHAARAGQLEVTLPESRLRWAPAADLARPCTDLSLDRTEFDATTLAPQQPADAPKRLLRPGRALALRADAYGPRIATLRLTSGDNEVIEIGRSGGRIRVFQAYPDELIFGWVSSRHLLERELGVLPPVRPLDLSDDSWDGLEAMMRKTTSCVCPSAVAIVAVLSHHGAPSELPEANYAAVGQIPAQRAFTVLASEAPLWQLRLPAPVRLGLRLIRSHLTVVQGDLESCSCQAAPRR